MSEPERIRLDPYVRILGVVLDLDGLHVQVGVDYDSVTLRIGGRECARLTPGGAEEFAQLFVSAVWQAGQQKARMDEDTATDARHEAIDRAEAFRDEMHDGTGASHD